MPASCREVRLEAWPCTLSGMATRDPNGEDIGLYIGARLQDLAKALGLTQGALAKLVSLDPRHFNNYWHDRRTVSLGTAKQIARLAGRSLAWLVGEEGARPLLGTVDALGRSTMTNNQPSFGTLHFVAPCGPFTAGMRSARSAAF